MATQDQLVSVVLYTNLHRIEGRILLLKGERLSDKLNTPDREFEPVENARVYSIDHGALLHEAPYLAVGKRHISLMLPLEDEA